MMRSIAYGLTALSPSVGQAEDFISKKGIPEDQVPTFLAKLGDPQLAGLIAQKQRLKQEQAKQVPPGGPQQGPPTVKDEINQQLAQIMQAQQQKQMGQQPPMPGQPPAPPQGGPPIQAAGGGLMGEGLGSLDAGSMEAPHHFDGGGVVALAAGDLVSSGNTVKSKEEVEKKKTTAATDPYGRYYDFLEKQQEEYKNIGPYKQLEDPTFAEREKLLAKRQAEAKQKYEEDRAGASRAGWLEAVDAAFSGKSLGKTIVTQMKTQDAKKLAAEDAYEDARKDLEDNLVELHKAQQAYKETGNKSDYEWKLKLQDKVSGLSDKMLNTMVDQTKFKAEQDYRNRSLAQQERQMNKPTDMEHATIDFYKDLKAAQIKGTDPSLKGLTDDELRAKARAKAMTLVTGMRSEAADTQNFLDNYPKVVQAAETAQKAYQRALAMSGNNEQDPTVIAAKQKAKQAQDIADEVGRRAGIASAGSSATGAGGGNSGVIDYNSLR
jgi:hypothetical protein